MKHHWIKILPYIVDENDELGRYKKHYDAVWINFELAQYIYFTDARYIMKGEKIERTINPIENPNTFCQTLNVKFQNEDEATSWIVNNETYETIYNLLNEINNND